MSPKFYPAMSADVLLERIRGLLAKSGLSRMTSTVIRIVITYGQRLEAPAIAIFHGLFPRSERNAAPDHDEGDEAKARTEAC